MMSWVSGFRAFYSSFASHPALLFKHTGLEGENLFSRPFFLYLPTHPFKLRCYHG